MIHLRAAGAMLPLVLILCGTLVYGGCRISEALALTADRVDPGDGVLMFENLKIAPGDVYRAVPGPSDFLERLRLVHDIELLHQGEDRGWVVRRWPWSRTTAWGRLSEVMEAAGWEASTPCPRGFGIKAVMSRVRLNMTQKSLGHSRIAMTALYANKEYAR